jgi:hypothetical protein
MLKVSSGFSEKMGSQTVSIPGKAISWIVTGLQAIVLKRK